MKRRKIAVTVGVISVVIAICLVVSVASTKREQTPAVLREMGVAISSRETQNIIYESDNSLQNVNRSIKRYIAENGDTYAFDNDGNPISFSVSLSDGDLSYSAASVLPQNASELIIGLLEDFVPDIQEFSFPAEPDEAEYGYVFTLLKNADTVCEDQIIARLNVGENQVSVNINRSGISDPSEIDEDYYEAELSSILEEHTDDAVEHDIVYKKVNDIICAFCTVTFQDASGGYYVEMYTVI